MPLAAFFSESFKSFLFICICLSYILNRVKFMISSYTKSSTASFGRETVKQDLIKFKLIIKCLLYNLYYERNYFYIILLNYFRKIIIISAF